MIADKTNRILYISHAYGDTHTISTVKGSVIYVNGVEIYEVRNMADSYTDATKYIMYRIISQ